MDSNGKTAMHAAACRNLPKAVEYLAGNGADIEAWNGENRFGWTPLAIATGYRFGNFKPSQVTIDALHRVMIAVGVLPSERVEATAQRICWRVLADPSGVPAELRLANRVLARDQPVRGSREPAIRPIPYSGSSR